MEKLNETAANEEASKNTIKYGCGEELLDAMARTCNEWFKG